MRVRVCYTVTITEAERLDLSAHFGEWQSREDIASYLEQEGTGGLEELTGESDRLTPEELREIGVPERVIRRRATDPEGR